MLFEEEYKTVVAPGTGEFREKGSRFLGFVYPVKTEKEIKEQIALIRKEHPKANHHCYAFRLGPGKSVFRFSDDREPSGSAGKPIYGVIQSFDLTDILIVVVRYFGGTLLGVSGLINAYRSGARSAVENCEVITLPVLERYELVFDYAMINEVMSIIKHAKATIISQQMSESCTVSVELKRTIANEFLNKIGTSHILKGSVKINVL